MIDKHLKRVSKDKVDIDSLQFQYIPRLVCHRLWLDSDVMKVGFSPHVDLLRIYVNHGLDYSLMMKSSYAELQRYWNDINFRTTNGNVRTEKFIKSKIDGFIKLFNSIKNKGFDRSNHLIVLKKPFWTTRYGFHRDIGDDYEIWSGHHRASCCYVLGIPAVPCKIFVDKKPNTHKSGFDKRLKHVKVP